MRVTASKVTDLLRALLGADLSARTRSLSSVAASTNAAAAS